jgi:integrase
MAHFPKPFFKKARGHWYVEINRRQINLGSDKEQAFKQYHRLMGEPRKERAAAESLVGIIDAFLEWTTKNRSPETYEWYRYRLERFARRYPDLRANDLRPYHVETWADSYELSRTSRRNYLRSVKRCAKWAKKQGYIDTNTIEDLEVPSGEQKEVVVTRTQFDDLLDLVRNPNLADLMIVTWDTGCRPQESLRVEARHVDLPNHRWVFQRSEAKTKRNTRVIYLTDRALAITRRLIQGSPEGHLFRNLNGKPWTTDAVNCGFLALQMRMGKLEMKKRGLAVSTAEIEKFAKRLRPTRVSNGVTIEKTAAELRYEAKQKLTYKLAATLVPRFSLYALRHSWATHALQNGVDPLTVAILMGHKDPSTLSKVYQHLSLNPSHMLEQARRAAG